MSEEGQGLHRVVVEVDGRRVLECDALNVDVRSDAEREFLLDSLASTSGYEVVTPRVIVEAELPGKTRYSKNLFF